MVTFGLGRVSMVDLSTLASKKQAVPNSGDGKGDDGAASKYGGTCFFWFWMLLSSAFSEPTSARKDVSANQNGEVGGK